MAALRREDGFTLIEAVVALVILALVAAWTFRGFDTGLQGLRTLEDEARALSTARALLHAAGTATPLIAGRQSGTSAQGMAWTTTITPLGSSAAGPSSDPQRLAMRIDVTVSWRDAPGRPTRDLTLTSVKLARAP